MAEDKTNALSALARGLPAFKPTPVPPLPQPPIPQPSGIPATPTGLLGLFSGLQTVASLYFNGQAVYVDGYRFVGCRFDNCTLYVNSANFELVNSVIGPTTKIHYGRGLNKVIALFTGRYPDLAYRFPPGFVPFKGANDAETIQDGGI